MRFANTKEIINCLNKFKKLYDIVRFVDPVSKEVLEINDAGECYQTNICYNHWKNETHCANCISSRAINENDTFVKVEYNKDRLYLVVVSPVTVGDKKCVFEMLKDITESGIVPNLKGKNTNEINDIIENLNKEVITDELTQVFNRRFLNERLPVDLYNALKDKTKLSVIMLDIDLFKNFNDTYGHLAGDIALKEVCNIIKSDIRKNYDWVARFGGEEFFISLPSADKKTAYLIAEEIRREVENKEIEYEGQKLHITLSAGIYTLDSDNIGIEEIINRADKNMYEAKHRGRNRVV